MIVSKLIHDEIADLLLSFLRHGPDEFQFQSAIFVIAPFDSDFAFDKTHLVEQVQQAALLWSGNAIMRPHTTFIGHDLKRPPWPQRPPQTINDQDRYHDPQNNQKKAEDYHKEGSQ